MDFLRKHKLLITLICILLVASFMRLYRISDYMTFLGDEGRDVLVALHTLKGDIPFLGPRASAGDFFLGPVYYYFITPFLLLFNYDPVGPAVMVALFGIATVYLVYHVGKEFFSTAAGLMAASLYAVSPLVLRFSRSSWNPNLMPFFSLLIMYLMYHAVKVKSWKLYLSVGFLYGIAMQLHYIEVFLGVIVFVFFIVGNWIKQRETFFSTLIKQGMVVILGFILGMAPFLAFEIKNGFPNTQTVFSFIFESNAESTYAGGGTFLSTVTGVFIRVFGALLLRFPEVGSFEHYSQSIINLWTLAIILVAVASILFLLTAKNKLAVILLGLWLFFGVVLFGFYKKPIYDYYFAFMFPLPFLLVGNLLAWSFVQKKVLLAKVTSLLLLVFLLGFNIWGAPFTREPNRMKEQARTISDFILDKTNGEPFNFALIADGNSDHAYRYFFEVENRAPVTIENSENDPERKTVTEQLFVVCENPPCEPLGHPLFEIAGFGQAKITDEWNVSVVKVYKLEPVEEISE